MVKISNLIKESLGKQKTAFRAEGGPDACPICGASPEQQWEYPGRGDIQDGLCRVCYFRLGRWVPATKKKETENDGYKEW